MLNRSPLVWGRKTYKDITDDIARLTESFPSPSYWLTLLGAKTLFLFYILVLAAIVTKGMGLMGVNPPCGLGDGYYHLCILDWDWPRRNFNFSHSLFISTEVENLHCPFGRSHDRFCCDDGGHFSYSAYGPSLVGLLASALSQPKGSPLGELSLPIGMGCFCRFHLRHSFHCVLVYRNGSRFSHLEGSF